jgi:hypothetical protein
MEDTNLRMFVSDRNHNILFLSCSSFIIFSIFIFIEYLRMALSKFEEYERIIPLPEWKILVEDKKENLKIWQRTSESGLKCMKAVSHINRPAELIIKVIGDSAYRNDYDPVYDYSDFLVKVAD